jgi:hypothetical protein
MMVMMVMMVMAAIKTKRKITNNSSIFLSITLLENKEISI